MSTPILADDRLPPFGDVSVVGLDVNAPDGEEPVAFLDQSVRARREAPDREPLEGPQSTVRGLRSRHVAIYFSSFPIADQCVAKTASRFTR